MLLMINGENWISNKCDLLVIKMENYNHNTHYDLPVKPSPNLPNAKAVNLYPSLCLFEGTNVTLVEVQIIHFNSSDLLILKVITHLYRKVKLEV